MRTALHPSLILLTTFLSLTYSAPAPEPSAPRRIDPPKGAPGNSKRAPEPTAAPVPEIEVIEIRVPDSSALKPSPSKGAPVRCPKTGGPCID